MLRVVAILSKAIAVSALAGCYQSPLDYNAYENQPLVRVAVEFRADSPEELESALRSFAHSNSFELRVARVHPTDPQFSILLWREDCMIIGTNPFGQYRFGVFPAKRSPIANELADQLASTLRRELVGA
jgi:hypothetical protein